LVSLFHFGFRSLAVLLHPRTGANGDPMIQGDRDFRAVDGRQERAAAVAWKSAEFDPVEMNASHFVHRINLCDLFSSVVFLSVSHEGDSGARERGKDA